MADIQVTEFAPACETVLATLHETMPTGESYTGPLHVGAITGAEEIWIEREGARVYFKTSTLPALIKQLRRAVAAAQPPEQPHDA